MKVNPTPTVFLQLRSRIRLPRNQTVKLGDVAFIVCEPEWEKRLRALPLTQPKDIDGNRLVMDLIQIILKIQALIPGAHIEPMGNHHTLVELIGRRASGPNWFPLIWLCSCFSVRRLPL